MSTEHDIRLQWWQDCRFGMFIHWGLYSIDGLDCWKMHDMGIPAEEFVSSLEPRFTGDGFDATAIAELAKAAGCKYAVMGTRHHDGFCLWDTRTTSFSSAKMTARRDFIAEFAEAVRAAGLGLGFYYSLLDWRSRAWWEGPRRNPEGWGKLVDYCHAQVREVLTDYGPVDILWYDGHWGADSESAYTIAERSQWTWGFHPSETDLAEAWRSAELNAMARELQPGILINNRSGVPGDFGTPEKVITSEDRPWELCDTLGDLWGCAPQDRNIKPVREVLYRLITCVSKGGNMLCNLGPHGDGSVQPWQADYFRQIGRWLAKHGEAIYGCTGEWQNPFPRGLAPWRTTRRDDMLYLHLLRYPGSTFSIANYQHDFWLLEADCLTTGQPLTITHEPTRDVITGLPETAPDELATVVRIRSRRKTDAEHETRYPPGTAAIELPDRQ